MTIAEVNGKCKSLVARVPRDALIIAVLVVASSASFGLGYLTGSEAGRGGGISIAEKPVVSLTAVPSISPVTPEAGQVVASKNGTKYYPPDCAGASRISAANKVSFASAARAMAAGYAPAANCKGL